MMTVLLELLAFFSIAALVLVMFWFGLIGLLGLPFLTIVCWGLAAWGGFLALAMPFMTDPMIRAQGAGWRLLFGVAVALALVVIVEHPGTDKQTYRRCYWVLTGLLPLALACVHQFRRRHEPTGAAPSAPDGGNA